MRYTRRYGLLLIFLLGCVWANPVAARDGVLHFNDVLEISVYDHPEMTTTVRIDGQGTVVLPLLNQVQVQGMTVSEASAHIAQLLADGFIINPQVNLFVKNFREQKASILGMVVKPGVYEINQRTTLLELISMAGGLTEEASDRAVLQREATRDAEGKSLEVAIDLVRLVEQGDTTQNMAILDGDKVFVAKAGLFYVTGQVKKPNAYKFQDQVTVIKAVAMAGGFTDIASTRSVRIVRKIDGREEVLTRVGMDELVRPDDVIVVPESFF